MRTKIIAANWKMNCTRADAERLVRELLPLLDDRTVRVVICPPFTALQTVAGLIDQTDGTLELGAQDVFWKEKGAYTGEISPGMLVDAGCRFVIVGHSERRGRFGVPEPDFDAQTLSYFGDNDTTVRKKLDAALAAGLTPICCVGETLAERQSGQTDDIVKAQTSAAMRGLNRALASRVVFAYEPVWAIGAGEVCKSDEANRVCSVIRGAVMDEAGDTVSEHTVIQYGGSVKPDNAHELLIQPNIDGALVGGASLKARDFAAIVKAV